MKAPGTIALLLFALASAAAYGQAPATADPGNAEQLELNQAMSEASGSAVDIIRALEHHLAKYPDTKQRGAIEQTILKSAVEANDGPRIILYGGKAITGPTRDLPLMDRVTFELVKKGDAESAKKALEYIRRYQTGITAMRQQPPPHYTPGPWADQMDRAMARSLALEAHARENSGDVEGALPAARRSWATYPNGDAAREIAELLSKMGKEAEAIEPMADAFTVEDPSSTETDRARDRARMGAIYVKVKGSEKGLGDVVLQAYDRTSAMMKARIESLKAKDPNARAEEIFDFTLPPVNGDKPLTLSSLRGKVVVLDFWATWCVPCRAQHPLLENVQRRFAGTPGIVFLPIDADDDTSLAAPFLKAQGWDEPAWFEGGLERKLMIGSIPTVVVLDPEGHISSRMIGFIPDRFEDMLTQRILEALHR
jgi:thiol-disulfide isomerase/thioredoxin